MEREQILQLWNDMWQKGNWIPSWPDSLAGLSAEQAAWIPKTANLSVNPSLAHSIWQEVVHVTFWRRATLAQMAGGVAPTQEEIDQAEFAMPDGLSEQAWRETLEALKNTHDEIAAALLDESQDVTRLPYHLIHDGYHLGRITQLRALQGTAPTF